MLWYMIRACNYYSIFNNKILHWPDLKCPLSNKGGPTISETQGYLGWDLNSITVDTWPSDFLQWIDQVYMLDRWNGQIFHFSMILGGAFSVQASFQGFFLCLNWHIIYLWGGTCYIWLQMIAREDFKLDFIPTLVPRWYLMPGWTLKRIQGKQKSIKNQSKLVHT